MNYDILQVYANSPPLTMLEFKHNSELPELKPNISYLEGRKHLPIVEIRDAAQFYLSLPLGAEICAGDCLIKKAVPTATSCTEIYHLVKWLTSCRHSSIYSASGSAPAPAVFGAQNFDGAECSICGIPKSRGQKRAVVNKSDGYLMFGSVAKAIQECAPTDDSSMPPIQHGMFAPWAISCIFRALVMPPTRPSLMLMKPQAPIWIAFIALPGDVMLSSRQIGVFNCFCNVAWQIKSSCISGCSIISRLNSSTCLNISMSSRE